MRDWTRSTRLPARPVAPRVEVVDAAAGPDLALFDQIGERGTRHDDDINRLPALKAQRDGVMGGSHGGPELGHKFAVGGAFIFGDQLQVGGRERPGSHHLDLGRAYRSRRE